jgi:hypothetical protein
MGDFSFNDQLLVVLAVLQVWKWPLMWQWWWWWICGGVTLWMDIEF